MLQLVDHKSWHQKNGLPSILFVWHFHSPLRFLSSHSSHIWPSEVNTVVLNPKLWLIPCQSLHPVGSLTKRVHSNTEGEVVPISQAIKTLLALSSSFAQHQWIEQIKNSRVSKPPNIKASRKKKKKREVNKVQTVFHNSLNIYWS